MRLGAILALLSGAVLFSGCAEMTHLTRTRSLTNGTAILIDAKQRGIFTRNGVVCAEPSPDALSAIAASQGLNISTPEGTSVGQSLSIAEAAGALGLRTQSIQLMRDHMYRVCEAYQSGAISPLTLQLFHRRFQTTVVGILAIEQLTGAVRAPAIVLGGSAAVGDAEAVVRLTTSREAQAALVSAAEQDLILKRRADTDARTQVTAADAALAQAGDDEAAVATATSTLNERREAARVAAEALLDSEGVLATRRAGLAAIDRALVLAQSSGSANASGTIESQQLGRADMAAVAEAVESIVTSTMGLTNSSDFCIMLLSEAAYLPAENQRTVVNPESQIVQTCLRMLEGGSINMQGMLQVRQ